MIKRSIFLLLFVFVNLSISFCQEIDKVVNKQIYTSYYSIKLKVPLYIVYELNNGGGDVSRKGMRFIEESITANNKDYSKSGYDRGHLVSAEDFAFNKYLEELTFSYFNVFPQHPKLNRGSWKAWENKIRLESKRSPLKIYVGGIYGTNKIKNKIAIPDYCWKVVYNKKTQRLLHVLLFKNDATQMVIRTTLDGLRSKLNYNINFSPK
jgi:endonuclease G